MCLGGGGDKPTINKKDNISRCYDTEIKAFLLHKSARGMCCPWRKGVPPPGVQKGRGVGCCGVPGRGQCPGWPGLEPVEDRARHGTGPQGPHRKAQGAR